MRGSLPSDRLAYPLRDNAGPSVTAKITARSKLCGPVIRTRTPPRGGRCDPGLMRLRDLARAGQNIGFNALTPGCRHALAIKSEQLLCVGLVLSLGGSSAEGSGVSQATLERKF